MAMKTPITTDQFFSVFEKYNHAIFPVQIILFLLSILALIAIGSKIKQKDKVVAGILGVIWIMDRDRLSLGILFSH